MIVQKIIGELVRTYSDRGVYIHGGYPEADYAEAIDPVNMNRTYVETNIPLANEDYLDSQDALDMIFGDEK